MNRILLLSSNNFLSAGERRNSESDSSSKSQLNDLITTLQSVKMGADGAGDRRQAMTSIIRMVRTGNSNVINDNFRTVLRVLLENLEDSEGASRALVFGVLTEMLKHDSLIAGFNAFTELIILKVLQAHKDPEKDVRLSNILYIFPHLVYLQVVRAAEACAATMAGVLPSDMVIRVLNPIIKTGDFPVNQAAIKMMTKVVEKQTPADMEPHVGEVMPGLLKVSQTIVDSIKSC